MGLAYGDDYWTIRNRYGLGSTDPSLLEKLANIGQLENIFRRAKFTIRCDRIIFSHIFQCRFVETFKRI